jgi:hypothetical protein
MSLMLNNLLVRHRLSTILVRIWNYSLTSSYLREGVLNIVFPHSVSPWPSGMSPYNRCHPQHTRPWPHDTCPFKPVIERLILRTVLGIGYRSRFLAV